jgi:hypothetical protein
MRGRHVRGRYGPLVLLLCVLGCNVSTKIHTPFEFYWRDYEASGGAADQHFLNGALVRAQISALGAEPAHRFLLEVKRDNAVRNLRVFVNINGVEHPMEPSPAPVGDKLWTYAVADECESISYGHFYRVTWRVPFGDLNERRVPATGTAATNVEGYQSMLWYSGPRAYREGQIALSLGAGLGPARIRFRNFVRPGELRRVERVEFDPASPDSPKFELVDPPALPVVLACGESIPLTIKWNAPGAYNPNLDWHDTTALHVYYGRTPDGGTSWPPQLSRRFTIHIRTWPPAF